MQLQSNLSGVEALRSDQLKRIKFFDSGTDTPLEESIVNSLQFAGYEPAGNVFIRNYHQAYCPVKAADGKTVGSGWQFHLNKKEMYLVGGREDEIPEEMIDRYAAPSKEMLFNLSSNSISTNEAWRQAVLEFYKSAEATYSKGTLVKIDPEFGKRITTDGYPLSEVIMSDGQRGVGFTHDAKRVRLPRDIRLISEVDHDFPIITPQTIRYRHDRGIAAAFLAENLVHKYPDAEFSGNQVRIGTSPNRDDSQMYAFYADGNVMCTVMGIEHSNLILDTLKAHNLENGYSENLVTKVGLGSVNIKPDNLSTLVKEITTAQTSDSTPSPSA